MKRFKVTATRTDEYIIEVDETLYNEEWRERFGKFMWELEEPKDIARDLAHHNIHCGSEWRFAEGYGNIARDGSLPFSPSDFDDKGNYKSEDQRDKPAPGLNIIIESEEDYDFEIEEISEDPQ